MCTELLLILIFSVLSVQSNFSYEFSFENGNSKLVNEITDENFCSALSLNVYKKSEIFNLPIINCTTTIILKAITINNAGLQCLTKKSFEEYLPKTVQNLTIINNEINEVPALTFSNLTLKKINLTNNEIQKIAPNAFMSMKLLELLILDDNKITIFNFNFSKCEKLKLISLKNNYITQLNNGILKDLKLNVLTLLLNNNKLKQIEKFALDVKQFHEVYLNNNELENAQLLIKLVKAEKVDLSENRIQCLPKEFMENGLSKIKMLNLTGNPLECKCLQDIRKKIRRNIEFQKMSPLVQNINIILGKNDTRQC